MYDITCCGQETEKANSVTAMGSLAVGELQKEAQEITPFAQRWKSLESI